MKLTTYVLILLLFPLGLHAQNLEDYLSKYTSENGKLYLQPFANAFSADLNSGLFHNAKIKKSGFQLYIGVVGQVAAIPNSAKYFTAHLDDPTFGSPMDVPNSPTVFGPTEGVLVENPESGLSMYMPAGLDIDLLPLAMPQITIGSLWGTDFTARYISVGVDDFGDIKTFGWGLRHSVNQYLKKLPVSIALGYYHQNITIGEYIDASTNVINLQASFAVPVVTFYGGLGYETGKVDVEYTYEGINSWDAETQEGDKIAFNMDAENTIRATLGLCLNLGPLKIHGDYNIAKQNTFAVGVGIGINQK